MNRRAGTALALTAALAGCAVTPAAVFPPPDPPRVWPGPPDAPRIRYVGALRSSADLHARGGVGDALNRLMYGPPAPARLVTPYAVAVTADGSRVAIADTNAACVHVFDLARRRYTRVDRYGDDGGNSDARPVYPVAVGWVAGTGAGADRLIIADAKRHALAVIDADGTVGFLGRDVLKRPTGLAVGPSGRRVYVSDAELHEVIAFDLSGSILTRFGRRGSGPGEFNFPAQVACSSEGDVAVADALNFRIQRFAPDGTPLGMFGSKGDAAGDLALPKGVAFGPDGNLWVVDARFENVQAFTPDGRLLLAWGGEGRGPGEFWLPAGICIDGNGRIWIADSYNRRVQVFELIR